MKKANVLWVSPTPPLPVNSGNRRHLSYMLDCARKRCGQIDFIQYGWEWEVQKFQPALDEAFNRFAVFPQPQQKVMSYTDYWGIDDWVSAEFVAFVQEFVRDRSYDIVFVEYVWMSKVLELFNGAVVKVLDTHDIFTNRDKLLESQGIEKQWFFTRAHEEQKGLFRADIVLGITQSDCRTFQSYLDRLDGGSNVQVLNCGTATVRKGLKKVARKPSRELTLSYVGSSNALNIQSINSFLTSLSSAENLGSEFHINLAGGVCGHVPDFPNIKIFRKGFVSDLDAFYEQADVVLAPMVQGTGLKIKSVEALEFGKPLMATQFATNDLPVRSVWHTFAGIEFMANFIGNWLSASKSSASRVSTLEFLKLESEIVFSQLEHAQREREEVLWGAIEAKVTQNSLHQPGASVSPARYSNSAMLVEKVSVEQPRRKRWGSSGPAVSVIIPVYNTEKYLERCLDSVLTDRLSNIEVLIVDDGSTDRSHEVALKYRLRDPRVKVIRQENLGQGVARNRGLDVATGEFVYFIDSDDVIGPDSLWHMHDLSVAEQLDICSPDRPYLTARPLPYISALPGWCCFVRRELLEFDGAPIRQPAIRSGQDGVFANMLLTRCARAGVSKAAKYNYEKRDESTFHSLKKDLSVVPNLVEQHLGTLRSFYDERGLYAAQAARFLLFLQDETYKWRFKEHLADFEDSHAERIYLAIKSEIVGLLPYVPEEAFRFVDRTFLSIASRRYSDFKAAILGA